MANAYSGCLPDVKVASCFGTTASFEVTNTRLTSSGRTCLGVSDLGSGPMPGKGLHLLTIYSHIVSWQKPLVGFNSELLPQRGWPQRPRGGSLPTLIVFHAEIHEDVATQSEVFQEYVFYENLFQEMSFPLRKNISSLSVENDRTTFGWILLCKVMVPSHGFQRHLCY